MKTPGSRFHAVEQCWTQWNEQDFSKTLKYMLAMCGAMKMSATLPSQRVYLYGNWNEDDCTAKRSANSAPHEGAYLSMSWIISTCRCTMAIQQRSTCCIRTSRLEWRLHYRVTSGCEPEDMGQLFIQPNN